MILKRLAFLLCLFLFPALATAQQAITQNPQAMALASSAFTILTGSASVNDITLNGTATRFAGSDVGNGNFTLKAVGTSASRLDLSLSDGTRSEIRGLDATGSPHGSFILPNGTNYAMAPHNCLTDAAWFFPTLSILSQASNPNVVLSYIGLEPRGAAAVQHIRFAVQSPSLSTTGNSLLSRLSTTDFYLDSSSLLPIAVVFNTHPDSDAGTNIAVEVDFLNYTAVDGVLIPFRIQKLVNGSLFLDLNVVSASVNSGLTASAISSN
jgi:hypothetical protein